MKHLLIVSPLLAGILLLVPNAASAQCGYGPCAAVYVAPAPVYVAPVSVQVSQPLAVLPAPGGNIREHGLGLGLGLRGVAGYAGVEDYAMYGGGLVIRYIPTGRFGLELTTDLYSSNADSTLVPISLSGLFFFNPTRHVQPYLIVGGNVTIDAREDDHSYLLAGAHAGVGVELLIGRHVGLTLDARGFIQGRAHTVDDDVEGGITFNTGFNIYL